MARILPVPEKTSRINSSTGKTTVLGICLGASTISMVELERENSKAPGSGKKHSPKPHIIRFAAWSHDGNPKQKLVSIIERQALQNIDKIVATGRKFRQFVNLTSIPEPEAVEHAYAFVRPDGINCQAVVSAGGETFMVYVLDKRGHISNVLTGNKCASGTGEFYLQQLRRMDVSLDEAAEWAAGEEPYAVSGRCSVFCKSDCTHATNKGIPKSRVTAGLCRMMAGKILELLKKVEGESIMIVGGTALNQVMIDYVRQEVPGLIVPDEALYFEALGAALWALDNETEPFPGAENLYRKETSSFGRLHPLKQYAGHVEFRHMERSEVQSGDTCILGLDVGSTTTKAVLLREEDNALLASVYLRTNGDPVGASRECYRSILERVREKTDPQDLTIRGLGVCGSGRKIAGLHGLTDGVVNEIIAHATAAVHFDPQVDTIFEIGGQDAKYTHLTGGVPSDYAMNEACSAGTGSFLEESAYETLGVAMEEIADIAMKGEHPPNFNDQCAAFISSDIKNAIHEGITHEDVIAGLVYSICLNYSNRVKGNRPVGEKIFMQGGVCYNRAVPTAMAGLVGKSIVVPPEPGLMGAFGVALAVKKRLELGLLEEQQYDLETLVNREVKYGKAFICKGGKEKCDRRCEITVVHVEDRKIPFGGACNRYYNLQNRLRIDASKLDLVSHRQKLVFGHGESAVSSEKKGPTLQRTEDTSRYIGINRSFLVNTYYPMFSGFFEALGYDISMPDSWSQEGVDQRQAAFCFPAELSHGFFHALLQDPNTPDAIFLPHIKGVPALKGTDSAQLCPFVQGEPFYLRSTFGKEVEFLENRGTKILSPMLDMTDGLETAEGGLTKAAVQLGHSRKAAASAFRVALRKQQACFDNMKKSGRQILARLEADPDRIAVVIIARSYNGFAHEAHKGIPHKFASRGILTVPFDFLDFENQPGKPHMYWGMGQRILRAGKLIRNHPQLFAVYITNFSCGPDSFLIGYFREIMGKKPSLTLELDNHTADAGLETRIEAFLDVVDAYRQVQENERIHDTNEPFAPARTIVEKGIPRVITSDSEKLPFTDPRVKLLIPSMGRLTSEALSAAFRSLGFTVETSQPPDKSVLQLGRANTTCKECLPLLLTTGSLLQYLRETHDDGRILVYFMPTGSGPCRFGQYYVFMEDLLRRQRIRDVALLSFSSANSYAGLSMAIRRRAWWSGVIADTMEDIRSMLLANAVKPEQAMELFKQEWRKITVSLEKDTFSSLKKRLKKTAAILRNIPLKRPVREVPVISLVGEIYVRRDALSRQYITERLAEKGFAVACSPVYEWLFYTDYLVSEKLVNYSMRPGERLGFWLKRRFMSKYEKRIKSLLAESGLITPHPLDMHSFIENASPFLSPQLTGEAILTVGCALTEVASHSCGVIAIGPFGCMPNRLSEAILNKTMTRQTKLSENNEDDRLPNVLTDIEDLPFLAIESDGSPFPQLITAKLETFCLRAERLHRRIIPDNKGL